MSSCSGKSPRSERSRPMKHAMLLCVTLAGACGPAVFTPPPPSPQRVYAIAEVDERPEIVLTPPLRYPEMGSDGVVVVRLVIDSAGNPEPSTLQAIQGSDSVLVAAARTLVLKTLFRPARVRGRVVQARIDVPVEFDAASRPPVTLHVLGDVYALDNLDERPPLSSGPTLNYPAALLLSHMSGRVVVEAGIATTARGQDGTGGFGESRDARVAPAARGSPQA